MSSCQAGRVPDFSSENMTGSRFEDVLLAGAQFYRADLTAASFRLVDLTGVTIRGAALVNMDLSGMIENLLVNGVDVVPLVEAELNRRYPERAPQPRSRHRPAPGPSRSSTSAALRSACGLFQLSYHSAYPS
jgi:uncharacterized protein YjbI with pentapeptide repeats